VYGTHVGTVSTGNNIRKKGHLQHALSVSPAMIDNSAAVLWELYKHHHDEKKNHTNNSNNDHTKKKKKKIRFVLLLLLLLLLLLGIEVGRFVG